MNQKAVIILAFVVLFAADITAQEKIAPLREPTDSSVLSLFFSSTNSEGIHEVAQSEQKLAELIEQLKRKQRSSSNSEDFLRSIFYYIHKKQLHSYDKYAIMKQTLTGKTFGCLSGTALYALVLDAFHIDYAIIELTNHVFLQVQLEGEYYLFESTLPKKGFRKLKSNLLAKAENFGIPYRELVLQEVVGSKYGEVEVIKEPFNLIGLRELAGLQEFNEATRLFGLNQFEQAIEKATEAFRLYPSKRNQELMHLIINKILKHELHDSVARNGYLNHYKNLLQQKNLTQIR